MEIIVGAFVVMVFLGLGYFTIILSRETWFQKKYHMEVVFQNVMGLRDGDSVVVRGMPVGKVLSLHLQPDGVHVVLTLDQPLHPRQDCRLSIVTTSILGGRYLQLEEGSPNLPEMPLDKPLRGELPQNLMTDAAEAVSAIKKALVDGGIIDNLKKAIASINEIADRVNKGRGTVGRLLSEDDSLYTNLVATVESIKNVASRVEKGEGTLGKLLSSDDSLYTNLAATAVSLKEITGRLERGEGTIGKLLSSDDQVYKDLSATVASLKTVTERIEKGEGTLGKLTKDEAVYDEVKKTLVDVRATIDDFRENLPVTTFSSILFGAF
jgi:phospholipid/cholesterol/gamma-HCH transport system substrate-binding protein